MSLHSELVELAADIEVPEGFRADAKGDVIVVSPQRPEHWQIILDTCIRLHSPELRTTSDVKIPGTGENAKAPDVGVFPKEAELHASNALAFVEVVSPSSRETDYLDKSGIYADAGVPEYLIVDPDRESWTLNTEPADGNYQHTVTKPITTPVTIAGVQVEFE
ncbi:Uma2 family endonuclease [Nocardia mexicana]|uniref:Putative restriction endonuclease n=1 Tax=Nocardia mexicana TaxID=279262 RepID=A0A370HBS4_9NOCA|nr:Uma2 family endonuclease [Nocardia mexicana]RDI54157.1 putative restriction endonuclease [Nocardia mexicana]